MPSRFPRLSYGDRTSDMFSARRETTIGQIVDASGHKDAADNLVDSKWGSNADPGVWSYIGLFRLTTCFKAADHDGQDPKGTSGQGPYIPANYPTATAKRVQLCPHGQGTSEVNDLCDLQQTDDIYDLYYLPFCHGEDREDFLEKLSNDEPVPLPNFSTGDFIWAVFDEQMGVWSVIAYPPDIRRFRLKECLRQWGTASASTYENSDITFTVEDQLGLACGSADTDTYGVAWRFIKPAPDCTPVWVVISLALCDTTAMARALDCIYPGDTGKTAMRQHRSSTGGYEDDPNYPNPITIDNTDCLVFALPGEIFPVRRDDRCDENWTPTAPYGLVRRVRVENCIDCGDSDEVTVLQTTCDGGSGSGCDDQESDCKITVCNTSNRPIAPCGPEEAIAFLNPGTKAGDGSGGSGSGEDTDCCWYLQSSAFPTRAKAKITSKLCPTDSTAAINTVTFPTFCGTSWPKPTTARNPYGLAGCPGADVELAPDFSGCECNWDIIQVKPVPIDLLGDMQLNCSGNTCTIEKKPRKQVLAWSCDDTVCGTADWEVVATGTQTTILTNLECSSGSSSSGQSSSCSSAVRATSVSGCIFCAGSPSSSNLLSLREITYVNDFEDTLEPGSGGSGEDDCGKITGKRKKICVVTCGESEQSASDVTVLTGESMLVSQGSSFDGCFKNSQAVVCVLAAGETQTSDMPGATCWDCTSSSSSSGT